MFKSNWDIFLFNPLILLLLFIFYMLILLKNIKIKYLNHKIFFIQTFLYWFAISIIIDYNFEFHNLFFVFLLNKKELFSVVIIISFLFYIFLIIIFYLFLCKFFYHINWNFFQYSIFGTSILGIFILIIYPSLITMIISLFFIIFGIITKTSYFLIYNKIYCYNFFPFRAISLVTPLITFSFVFGGEFINIINILGNNLTNNLKIIIIGIVAILSILLSTILYIFFSYKNINLLSFEFTIKQKKVFEQFEWKKILIIFFMIILIIILKKISQLNIYIWLLGQRTWEKYHNNLKVNKYINLNKQLFLIFQFFGAYLACNLFYNKIGVKYSFSLGLLLWFIFFSVTAFNHSPEVYLILQIINGLSFSICFNILFAITCEWKYRSSNKKPIIAYFQLLIFGIEFIIKFIDNFIRYKNVGIFNEYIYGKEYIINNNFAIKIDNITTIISTICAIIVLILLLIFYYISNLILAEYRNHLNLLIPKINFLLK